MRKIQCILSLLMVFAFFTAANAEFYRYTDEKGVVRYTDDLSQVPADQREKARSYVSEKTPDPVKDPSVGDAEGEDDVSNDGEDIEVSEGRDLADLEKMNRKKAALDKEYAELVREKDALVKSKEGITRESELKAYNEQIVQLNERISVFEIRRQDFAREVEAFNQRFKE